MVIKKLGLGEDVLELIEKSSFAIEQTNKEPIFFDKNKPLTIHFFNDGKLESIWSYPEGLRELIFSNKILLQNNNDPKYTGYFNPKQIGK